MAESSPDTKLLDERIKRAMDEQGASGGNGGDGLEPRLAKVEATIEHVQSDISEIKKDIRETRGDWKILMGAIATTFVLLAGGGAAAYMNLGDKLFKMNENLTIIIQKLSQIQL